MHNESTQIHVIGIEASCTESFFEAKEKIILNAEKIAAPKRFLNSFKIWLQKKNINTFDPDLFTTDKLTGFSTWLKKDHKKTIIFSGGDPLWFGIGKLLTQNFPLSKLYFEPAPTSFQLAFSRLGKPWQNTQWISLHGREEVSFEKAIQKLPSSLVVLTDPSRGGAKEVWELLQSVRLENNYELFIFERLGYKNERISKINSNEHFPKDLDPLHLVILFKRPKPLIESEKLPLFGINDSIFLQSPDYPGLITKREIRVQILAELNLPKKGIIWDIGSGTGSIGLEALRISPNLKLVSIDKRIGSKITIEENSKRLGVKPSLIIEDEALSILKEKKIGHNLLNPDRVILGGGGQKSHLILEELFEQINSGCIIVIPLISIKSLSRLETLLKPKVKKVFISQHQSYKGIPIGEDTRFTPLNPVFILKGEFK